jgi:hypothetical protein
VLCPNKWFGGRAPKRPPWVRPRVGPGRGCCTRRSERDGSCCRPSEHQRLGLRDDGFAQAGRARNDHVDRVVGDDVGHDQFGGRGRHRSDDGVDGDNAGAVDAELVIGLGAVGAGHDLVVGRRDLGGAGTVEHLLVVAVVADHDRDGVGDEARLVAPVEHVERAVGVHHHGRGRVGAELGFAGNAIEVGRAGEHFGGDADVELGSVIADVETVLGVRCGEGRGAGEHQGSGEADESCGLHGVCLPFAVMPVRAVTGTAGGTTRWQSRGDKHNMNGN